jgi:hypothetical protein
MEKTVRRTITRPRLVGGNDERPIVRRLWGRSIIERRREQPRQSDTAFTIIARYQIISNRLRCRSNSV